MEDLLQQEIKLKEITPHSWLMINETNSNVGLLAENSQNIVILAEGYRERFESRAAVCAHFGTDLFENVVKTVTEEREHFVHGYPVKFHEPFAVETEQNNNLPLYTKTESGTVIYAAGHYIIHFPKGPLLAYCPKYATLTKYGFDGPFKTELEVKTVHLQLKKKAENDKGNTSS